MGNKKNLRSLLLEALSDAQDLQDQESLTADVLQAKTALLALRISTLRDLLEV